MDKLKIKYCAYDKAIPPQQIRMSAGGWGGLPQKMEDGSEPQPWHCLPFVEASTHGLELIYPYETECHVVNENGAIRFDWDFARESGGQLTGGEFVTFFPKEASRYYLFNTSLDIQAPPGHVLRTEPHPRFFTDDTGTVPLAMIGQVQTEWWPKRFFVVFRVPAPGHRHVFRKGEPYVQLLIVPQRVSYELTRMTPEEEKRRRDLEHSIILSAPEIATNVWRNPAAYEFSNHYKVLAGAFTREGLPAVEQAAREARQRQDIVLAADKPIEEHLQVAYSLLRQEKYLDARHVYLHVLEREPANPEALARLGIIAMCTGVPMLALKLLGQAIQLRPASATYHSSLGEVYRLLGRYQEAEACFREALRLNPDDAGVMSTLGLTLAQQGRSDQGLQACRAALAASPQTPVIHFRTGLVLAQQRRFDEARACQQAALALDPSFAPARRALQELPPTPALDHR